MNTITKTMLISMITNTFLSLLKIFGGLVGKCNSLIADGIHSISDLSTDIIAIVGNKLSLKPADDKHPYGHGKIEYLTSFIISIIILILGFSIIYSTINNQTVIPDIWILSISFITIVSKFLLSNFIIKKGILENSMILISSGKESKSDALSSIGVFISIIVMQLSEYLSVLKYADKLASIIIAILIIKTGFNILKENIGLLLGEQLIDDNYLNEIENIICKNEKLKIKKIHILKNGPYNHLVSTIIMDNTITLKEAHDKADEIELKLKEYDNKIKYVTIHIEPTIDK